MLSRLAFLSDIHWGSQQDLKAWNFTLKILSEIQPDKVVLGGDCFDHNAVGRYRKNPDKTICMQDEITSGKKHLEDLVNGLNYNTEVAFFSGNHEKRLPNYILDISKALFGLDMFSPRKLYGLDDLNIRYQETTPYKIGHLWLAHGDEFPTSGPNPALTALSAVNSNILFGHVHKFSVASKTQLNGRQIGGWSNGCLANLAPDFTLMPSWSQGFTIVDFTNRGYFNVVPVRYWYDRKFRSLNAVVDGVEYDSREGY